MAGLRRDFERSVSPRHYERVTEAGTLMTDGSDLTGARLTHADL